MEQECNKNADSNGHKGAFQLRHGADVDSEGKKSHNKNSTRMQPERGLQALKKQECNKSLHRETWIRVSQKFKILFFRRNFVLFSRYFRAGTVKHNLDNLRARQAKILIGKQEFPPRHRHNSCLPTADSLD